MDFLFLLLFLFPVFLCSSVYVCAPVMDGKICWLVAGGYTKEDGIWKTLVQFVFERHMEHTGRLHENRNIECTTVPRWSLGVCIGQCIHLSTFTWEGVC